MHRHASYAYAQAAPTTHKYSSTSSAFSASANPNEDWTKISDLAERRRIQNRIAQRNYRKKLKKRLEDLERRAASNSASPEQRPAELDRSPAQPRRNEAQSAESTPVRHEAGSTRRSPDIVHHTGSNGPYMSSPHYDDRNMFSQNYPRQLSVSPPPFSYSTYPPDIVAYSPYQPPAYHSLPSSTGAELPAYTPYSLPPLTSAYSASIPSLVHPVKQELYPEEEISPFSMSYASMAGIDIPAPHSYHESAAQTPPLSESFGTSTAGSPSAASSIPTPPASMPPTPPRLRYM